MDYSLEVRDGWIYLDGEQLTKGDEAYAKRLMSRYNKATIKLLFFECKGSGATYVKYYGKAPKGRKPPFLGYLWFVEAPGRDRLEIVARNQSDAKADARNLWRSGKRLPNGTTLRKVEEREYYA